MKKKIFVLLVSIVLLVGIISGCVEEEKAENNIPTAIITCVEIGYVDAVITFTDASTDDDGTIANWSWDLGDDGVIDSTDQDFTYTFTAEGTYTITLIVTDDDGAASEKDTCIIVISYEPPTALFTWEPTVDITVNETAVNFTSTSVKGYANITSYSWDFNGDDVEDANTSEAVYTFNVTGNISVSLMITDEQGNSDTKIETITVIEATT